MTDRNRPSFVQIEEDIHDGTGHLWAGEMNSPPVVGDTLTLLEDDEHVKYEVTSRDWRVETDSKTREEFLYLTITTVRVPSLVFSVEPLDPGSDGF